MYSLLLYMETCLWVEDLLSPHRCFFLGVFPHRFEQQVSISLFHQETQLPERGVVSCAAAFQSGNQFLVLRVVLQEVPDGEDCPLADD